ncbi:hypothetical protein BGZ95_002714 [Linnemannia exigua]|uniref:Uncharacterized protein n=1 Tax=Linnemannia exigua TaxID=604196 RepID=A0AAD4DIC3_9FUNG|nr:hypothetical protein BGZ95_002714 [Linnemannia exigua]
MQSYGSSLTPQRFQHVVHRRRCGACYTISIRPRLSVHQDSYVLIDDLRHALGYLGEVLLFLDEHQTRPLTIFNHPLATGECTAYYPHLTLFYRLVDEDGKTILDIPPQSPLPGSPSPSQFNSYQSGDYSNSDQFSANSQQQPRQESSHSQPRLSSSPTRFNSYQQGHYNVNDQNYDISNQDYDNNKQVYNNNNQAYDINYQDYDNKDQDYDGNNQEYDSSNQDYNNDDQDPANTNRPQKASSFNW